jgi:hypothetical protein
LISPMTGARGIQMQWDSAGVLLLEHDWATAFANASGDDLADNEVVLPYDCTIFELRVAGLHVIAYFVGDGIAEQAIFCRNKNGWFFFGYLRLYPGDDGTPRWFFQHVSTDRVERHGNPYSVFAEFLARQARAVAVALDAEVATREVVRAPYKLNRLRKARGKLPIWDYHVVKLAHRRDRLSPVSAELRGPLDPNREIKRKRLHFRRSHWRHYANFRTRIKWMLVGDPDLGFVDKEYRL